MELLVVITIITILAAMLLPALQEVRKKAKYARWLGYSNNLRCDNRLVAYYNFEEGEGDRLKNKAVGPYVNTRYAPEKLDGDIEGDSGAAWVEGRWPGKGALTFLYTDHEYVNCGKDPSLNITDEITMEIWVKPFDGHPSPWLIRKDDGWQPNAYGLQLILTDDGLEVRPQIPSVTSGGCSNAYLTEDLSIPFNKFSHIVATYDGAERKIFIDGEKRVTTAQTPPMPVAPNEYLYIAATGLYPLGNPGSAFNGVIDEVAIYNRALTEEEIKIHYKAGKP